MKLSVLFGESGQFTMVGFTNTCLRIRLMKLSALGVMRGMKLSVFGECMELNKTPQEKTTNERSALGNKYGK
jgi:hypothetical protein